MAPAAGASSGMWDLARERVDPRGERIDLRFAVERADLDVVYARLARSQVGELAPLTSVEAPCVAVRGRLHGYAVSSFAEHPPHRVEGKLLLPVHLVGAEA